MCEKQTVPMSCAKTAAGILRNRLMMSGAGHLALATLLLAVASGPAWGQCQSSESAGLTALNPSYNEEFGFSVAVDGDVAVIGAPSMDVLGGGGSAFIFRFDGASWVVEAELVPLDNVPDDEFGNAVAISGDIAVVAAHYDDEACPSDPNCDSGSVYIYQFDGAEWVQIAKLTASDALMWDNFGKSVAIDGDTIVVGANLDDGADVNTGSAYVFVKPPEGWTDMTETCKLTPAGPEQWEDQFGNAVSVSGNTIVVGSHYDREACPEDPYCGSGSAYVFEFDGANWAQVAMLTASDTAYQDRFGISVSISGDVALVGAWADDDGDTQTGSAYVFEEPAGGWTDMTETAKLNAWDAAAGNHFGWSVAINGDIAVVGAPANIWDGVGPGAAYVFQYTGGVWTEQAKLVSSDGVENSLFGCSVAVTDQGVGVFGSSRHPGGGYMNGGAAYVRDGLTDCNATGTIDLCDIIGGSSSDDNGNGIPDECECPGDLNGDNVVNLSDLAQLLANYGTPSGATYEMGDLDGDGDVDLADLSALLAVYGTICE